MSIKGSTMYIMEDLRVVMNDGSVAFISKVTPTIGNAYTGVLSLDDTIRFPCSFRISDVMRLVCDGVHQIIPLDLVWRLDMTQDDVITNWLPFN